jgi:hypothetical protein
VAIQPAGLLRCCASVKSWIATSLLAMTISKRVIALSPNGSAFVRTLQMNSPCLHCEGALATAAIHGSNRSAGSPRRFAPRDDNRENGSLPYHQRLGVGPRFRNDKPQKSVSEAHDRSGRLVCGFRFRSRMFSVRQAHRRMSESATENVPINSR